MQIVWVRIRDALARIPNASECANQTLALQLDASSSECVWKSHQSLATRRIAACAFTLHLYDSQVRKRLPGTLPSLTTLSLHAKTPLLDGRFPFFLQPNRSKPNVPTSVMSLSSRF